MRTERTQFISQIEDLKTELNELNDLYCDSISVEEHVAKLEDKVKQLNADLEISLSNENELREGIIRYQMNEQKLHSEINKLEAQVDAYITLNAQDEKKMANIEVLLEKRKKKWLNKSNQTVSEFILKDERTAKRFTGLSYLARLSLWNFLG